MPPYDVMYKLSCGPWVVLLLLLMMIYNGDNLAGWGREGARASKRALELVTMALLL